MRERRGARRLRRDVVFALVRRHETRAAGTFRRGLFGEARKNFRRRLRARRSAVRSREKSRHAPRAFDDARKSRSRRRRRVRPAVVEPEIERAVARDGIERRRSRERQRVADVQRDGARQKAPDVGIRVEVGHRRRSRFGVEREHRRRVAAVAGPGDAGAVRHVGFRGAERGNEARRKQQRRADFLEGEQFRLHQYALGVRLI